MTRSEMTMERIEAWEEEFRSNHVVSVLLDQARRPGWRPLHLVLNYFRGEFVDSLLGHADPLPG